MDLEIDKRIKHEKEHGAKLSSAGAEDIWNWSSPAGSARALRRAQFFLEYMFKGAKCLELGCGTGYFSRLVASCEADITAVDISEDLLDEARSKTDAPNITYEIADAHKLKYKNNFFDVVFGSSILHHLDIKLVLQEAFRVLKPGGVFVFAEPNLLNPQIWAERNIEFVRKKMGASPDETAFIRFSLKSKMKETGFSEVNIIPHEFLHPAIPEKMIGAFKRLTFVLEKIPLVKEIAGSLLIIGKKPL